jgi:hypothetical protein
MKKFLITEAEKSRILGMHYNAMGKSLVNEQRQDPEEFAKAGIRAYTGLNDDDVKQGRYAVYFTENTNNRNYYYRCAANPQDGNQAWNKPGAIYDASFKIANDPFVLSQTPEFKKIMTEACKPVFDYLAQQRAKTQTAPAPQVAAATTSKVNAPNPVSDQSVADDQKRSEEAKANIAKLKSELTTKLADPNFLNPNKYDTDKSGLDADAKRASLFTVVQGVATGDEAMGLKRKINNLIKAKPEYKAEPFGLNINF